VNATLAALRSAVEGRSALVGVVGLGYVGLPAACMFASSGFKVHGVDIDSRRIDKINSGESPIEGDEPGLDTLVKQVITSHQLTTSTAHTDLTDADVVLICVDTPVDADHRPRFKARGRRASSWEQCSRMAPW